MISEPNRGLLTFFIATLAIVTLGGVGNAQRAGFGNLPSPVDSATRPKIHRVQAKQNQPLKLLVDVSIQGKAGDKLKFPARIEPAGIDTSQFVMLYQVPSWLKVIGGESVGNGVWLVQAKGLSTTELQFEAAASGRQEIVVSLLAANGTDVASESKLVVNVARAGAENTAPRTWQALVGGGPAAAPASKTAQSAPIAAKPSGKDEAELVQYARHLVRECTTCHSLFGTDSGIPVMVGLSRDRFLDTMSLYRTGRREHGPMKAVADSLDERETLALALYLGRIKPGVAGTPPSAASTGAVSATPIALVKRDASDKPERIDRWIKRGQDFLKTGEVAQARLLFERAAEHGSALGAYLLGTSFDPNTLPWRPGMGLEAEPARARDWYVFAKQLGDIPDADQRLSDLR